MNLHSHHDMLNFNLQNVYHPLVSDMYLKREYGQSKGFDCKDVLVIETNFSDRDHDHEAYTGLLAELLISLPLIREQVEETVGTIDRVDIKTH